MNKIVIDTKEFNLIIDKNENYSLEITNTQVLNIKVLANITSKVTVLIPETNININLELEANSNLLINQLSIDNNLNLDINLLENSNLQYIISFLSSNDSLNNITINHKESNSHSKVVANAVNLSKHKLYLSMNGIIPKISLNCFLEENSKIINLNNGDSKIIPNLIIDNKEVVANHSAFIGNFKEDEVNYLKSRGLNQETINDLLLKATLLNGMKLEYDKDKFIYFIRNYKKS